MPIVRLPFVGAMNYFQNGRGDGAIVMMFALVAVLLLVRRSYRMLWIPGLGSLAVVLFTFINLQHRLSETREEMAAELADNPFRGIAEAMTGTVQLQWGWAVLVVGSVLLLLAAFEQGTSPNTKIGLDWKQIRLQRRELIVCLGIIIVVCIAWVARPLQHELGFQWTRYQQRRALNEATEVLAAKMSEPTNDQRLVVDKALGPSRLKRCGEYRISASKSEITVMCGESADGVVTVYTLNVRHPPNASMPQAYVADSATW